VRVGGPRITTPEPAGGIRTPDQRLRVFVSSTLAELSPERQAARAAIESLRLSPVLFEAGARPHPPRALYRAYLAQSEIFVGLYWERYGWVSPGEEISGLEDEYRLSEGLPRLLYVKEPAPQREPRLRELLDRVKREDQASYRKFADAEELGRLVADDLALLLAERFGSGRGRPASAPRLPAPMSSLVGREEDLAGILAALLGGTRMLTLTGPGGVGKTRLALEAAWALSRQGREVWPAWLDGATEPDQALARVAQALDLRPQGGRPPLEAAAEVLRGSPAVLLLDNLEQVPAVAAQVATLLAACPGLQILATSRRPLGIAGEQVLRVRPLPGPGAGRGLRGLAEAPATRLFLERSRAAGGPPPGEADAPAVGEIVRRLDGLPLAIELIAARTRVLPPAALLERLSDRLDLVAGGGEDVPRRQRALRASFDASFGLLAPGEQALLARLGAFAAGFGLDAVEAVCADGACGDGLEALSALVDHSLVEADPLAPGGPRFRMLETVRAYARDRLAERGEASTVHRRVLDYQLDLAGRAAWPLRRGGQRRWVELLSAELPNLTATARACLSTGEVGLALRLLGDTSVAWWVSGQVLEVAGILALAEAGAAALPAPDRAWLDWLAGKVHFLTGDDEGAEERLRRAVAGAPVIGDHRCRADAQALLANLALRRDRAEEARALADDALAAFQEAGDRWGVAQTLDLEGMLRARGGDLGAAAAQHQEALAIARTLENEHLEAQQLVRLASLALARGNPAAAGEALAAAVDALGPGRYEEMRAQCLEGYGALALAEGNPLGAAELLGAAAGIRARLGLVPFPAARAAVAAAVATARARLATADFRAAWERGEGAGVDRLAAARRRGQGVAPPAPGPLGGVAGAAPPTG
jgi:predicted ATPase